MEYTSTLWRSGPFIWLVFLTEKFPKFQAELSDSSVTFIFQQIFRKYSIDFIEAINCLVTDGNIWYSSNSFSLSWVFIFLVDCALLTHHTPVPTVVVIQICPLFPVPTISSQNIRAFYVIYFCSGNSRGVLYFELWGMMS